MRRVALRVLLAAGLALAIRGEARPATEHEIHLTARKFDYSPAEIVVVKGEPVMIEMVSLDRRHGFVIPELKIRGDAKPGERTVVRFTPDKTGRFDFHCDVFCGSGHESMSGALVVVESR